MSKRLQVIIDDDEFTAIRKLAAQQKISVAEWVRKAIQKARQSQPSKDANRKLEAIRAAVRYDFPTGDIDQMLGEIESGYGTG